MDSLEQIIKGCKQYNKFAQKLLYEKYAPGMHGVCLRYVADPELVKDIVQEGFIKVFSNIKQYKGEGSFEGWMKRIFVNTSLSFLRKQKNSHKFLKIDDIDLSAEEEHLADEVLSMPDKQETYAGKDNFQLIVSADFSEVELLKVLEKLPEKYRVVFNLFCIENYKHEEIAGMLNIDIVTSRTRLMRARNIIQQELYGLSISKLNT